MEFDIKKKKGKCLTFQQQKAIDIINAELLLILNIIHFHSTYMLKGDKYITHQSNFIVTFKLYSINSYHFPLNHPHENFNLFKMPSQGYGSRLIKPNSITRMPNSIVFVNLGRSTCSHLAKKPYGVRCSSYTLYSLYIWLGKLQLTVIMYSVCQFEHPQMMQPQWWCTVFNREKGDY